MDDRRALVTRSARERWCANRFLSAVRDDQRLRPSPHTPAQKEHEAAAVLGWQGFAESCHAQDLILVRKGGWRIEHAGAVTCSPGIFF